jgi:hypothetical protein
MLQAVHASRSLLGSSPVLRSLAAGGCSRCYGSGEHLDPAPTQAQQQVRRKPPNLSTVSAGAAADAGGVLAAPQPR